MGDKRKGERPLDLWSWVHFVAGLVLGAVNISWWLALVLIVGYEVVEAGLRRIKTEEGGLFEYESWPNIGVDIIVGFAGWAIAFFARRAWVP